MNCSICKRKVRFCSKHYTSQAIFRDPFHTTERYQIVLCFECMITAMEFAFDSMPADQFKNWFKRHGTLVP